MLSQVDSDRTRLARVSYALGRNVTLASNIYVRIWCFRYSDYILLTMIKQLRGVSFIVRAGNDIIKADSMHTKRTTFPTIMKIGKGLEELQ